MPQRQFFNEPSTGMNINTMGNNFSDHSKENVTVDFGLCMFTVLCQKTEKPVFAFYTTLFQPEHLNIKLNTGELFSLLILNYCKMYKRSAKSLTLK